VIFKSIGDYVITDHAAFEMKRRKISSELIEQILLNPEQRVAVRVGREVFQSRVLVEDGRYLFRIIVDVDRKPMEVVTVYRTSKIEKYWEKTL
jgi:hypothetical protein